MWESVSGRSYILPPTDCPKLILCIYIYIFFVSLFLANREEEIKEASGVLFLLVAGRRGGNVQF